MRCFVGRVSFGRCDGIRDWSGLSIEELNLIFKRGQAVHCAIRITVDRCLPESRLI